MAASDPLIVERKDEKIVISIGEDILIHALGYGLEARLQGELQFTDKQAFIADFVRELNNEEEDGTTPVHRMLDNAAYDAICSGAEGVEITEPDSTN